MRGEKENLQTRNARDRAEVRFLECVGVRLFRGGIFALERLRHRKDGGRNRNYHLWRMTAGSAAAFEGYLLYHTLLHLTAMVLLAVPAALLHSRAGGLHWADVLLVLLFLLNLYCLLLQRYTFLRIRMVLRRREQMALRENPQLSDAAAALLRKLSPAVTRGKTVVLTESDLAGLRDLAAAEAEAETVPEETCVVRDVDLLRRRLQLPGRRERFCHNLQRVFTPKRKPMLARGVIVTAGIETEEAFPAAFGTRCPAEKLRRLSCALPEGGGSC